MYMIITKIHKHALISTQLVYDSVEHLHNVRHCKHFLPEYIWYIILCKFEVYSVLIGYNYILYYDCCGNDI